MGTVTAAVGRGRGAAISRGSRSSAGGAAASLGAVAWIVWRHSAVSMSCCARTKKPSRSSSVRCCARRGRTGRGRRGARAASARRRRRVCREGPDRRRRRVRRRRQRRLRGSGRRGRRRARRRRARPRRAAGRAGRAGSPLSATRRACASCSRAQTRWLTGVGGMQTAVNPPRWRNRRPDRSPWASAGDETQRAARIEQTRAVVARRVHQRVVGEGASTRARRRRRGNESSRRPCWA